jgi:hypothetical protein
MEQYCNCEIPIPSGLGLETPLITAFSDYEPNPAELIEEN